MKKVYFKFGTFGRWKNPVILISHSGEDWNKRVSVEELSYWIKDYTNNGYEVVFKNNYN